MEKLLSEKRKRGKYGVGFLGKSRMRNLKQIRYNIYTLQRIITLSDQIIPSELLLSRARVPFFWLTNVKAI